MRQNITRGRPGGRITAQSALEFLVTYSWAFLVIIIMISIALLLPSVGNVASYVPPSCYIQPTFPCLDTLLTGYTSNLPIQYSIVFTNKLQTTMYFPANSFNVSMTNVGVYGRKNYIGNCTPQLAQPGAQVICNESIAGTVEPGYGGEVSTSFILYYQICGGTSPSTCSPSIYKTTGDATQTIGIPGGYYILTVDTNLYYKAGSTIASNGYVLLDGSPYYGGSRLLLPAGTYLLAPQQSTQWDLASYQVASGSATVNPSAPANGISTLTLYGNATIYGSFTEALCNLCNYSNGGAAPQCPASCQAQISCAASPSTSTTTTTTTSAGSTSLVTTTIGTYACYSCAAPAAGYVCPGNCPNAATCGPNSGGIECVSSTGFGGTGSLAHANETDYVWASPLKPSGPAETSTSESYSVTISPSYSTTIPAVTSASTTIPPSVPPTLTYTGGICQPVKPGYACPTACPTGVWCMPDSVIACFGGSCGPVPSEKECT